MKLLSNQSFLSLYFITLLGCVLSVQPAAAQRTSHSNSQIHGVVKDTDGHPLAGVNITLPKIDRGTFTYNDGSYVIKNLTAGNYALRFSFVGFGSKSKKVSLKKGQTKTLNVILKQQSQQLSQVVVTGTAVASNQFTAPADIYKLSGRAKLESEQTSLGATLDKLAGISTISTGPQVGKPVIHGLHGNRIRVLSNGTPDDYEQFGVRHGPNVDPYLAERIEVVKGAASVQYGSDALGGAVNVISHPIPDAIGEHKFIRGNIISSFATNNNEYSGGLHLEGATGRLGFTGTFIKRTAGDIHTPNVATFKETDDTSAPKFSGDLNNTDFDQLNGSFGVGYTSEAGPITARYKYYHNNQNLLLPNGKGLGQNLANNTLQLKGDFGLGNYFRLKPKFTFNSNLRQSNAGGKRATPRSALPDQGFAFLDLLIHSYTSSLKLQHPSVGPFKGTLGVIYLHEDRQTRGQEALVPGGTINNIGSYLFEKATFNRFTLSAGARIDARWQDALSNETLQLPDFQAGETRDVLHQNYTAFSGIIGATYLIIPHFIVAANAGRGFRAPSFFNLHALGFHGGIASFQEGDPNLKPERSTNTQLSLRWHSKAVTAKLTGYRNYIKNYIYLVNTGIFRQGSDVLKTTQGSARLLGGEGTVRAQLQPWLQIHSDFEVVKGKNVDDALPNIDALPLLPANTVGGGLKFMKSQIATLENGYVGISIKHAFFKKAAGPYEPFYQFGNSAKFSDFGVASTNAYTLLTASAGFDLPLWNRPITFNVTARNLLNTAYRDFLDTYKGYALSPGRSITLRIKIPFGIK